MKQLNLIITSIAMLVGLVVLVSILTEMDGEQTSPQIAEINNDAAEIVQTSNDAPLIKVKSGAALETPNPLGEVTLGDADAPIKVYEYASLTCGHCAAFHNDVLPDLKKQYVDTGLVQFNFRPFPLDPYAMTGAMLVQCVTPKARLAFLETLFKRQMQWVRSDDPLNSLRAYAKQAGMSGENFVMCLQSEGNLTAVRSMYSAAKDELGVESTPTFFVNGEKVAGNIGLEKFKKILDKKLKKMGIDAPEEKESSGL
jgi:protein-disulfide isomerase